MEITLAALADYAAVTDQGKLVIAGVFDRINVPHVPVVHPSMTLALRIQAHPGEATSHELNVRLVDPDGDPVIGELKGHLEFREQGPTEGASVQVVLHMAGVTFKKLGPHAIDVLIDGRHERSLPLWVREGRRGGPPPGKGGEQPPEEPDGPG